MNNLLKLKELMDLSKEAGLDEVVWFRNGLLKLSHRFDPFLYQKLLQACLSSPYLLLQNEFSLPKGKEEITAISGQYPVGKISDTDLRFGLWPEQLQMHTVLCGATGEGKTTIAKILGLSIIKEGNVKIWYIDPKPSGDYRILLEAFPDDVLILPPSELKVNPFNEIENVPKAMLQSTLIEVTADSFGALAGEGIIAKHMQKVFQEYPKPCFSDFVNSISQEKAGKFKQRGYLEFLDVNIQKTMIALKNVFDCRQDYFSNLWDKNVIWEIGELSGSAQKILCAYILMKLILYKTKNPTPGLTHLIVVDEAQTELFSKRLDSSMRQPYMATLATQVRAFGCGLFIIAQNPTKLISEIIGNSNVKLCLRLGSGEDIKAMSQHMGLTYEQAQTLLKLNIGECVVRTGHGFKEPFKVQVFNSLPDRKISESRMEELLKHRWNELLSLVVPVRSDTVFEQEEVRQETDDPLNEDDKVLLQDIKNRPFEFSTQRYKSLLSQNRAIKSKKRLMKLGYLEEVQFNTGKRGNKPSLLRLTEKAFDYLNIEPSRGKGSLEHVWYQNLIAYIVYIPVKTAG